MADYIDNKKFLEALKDYKVKCDEATEQGKDIPIPSNYIGECFMLLCNKIATRWNFTNYSYKDEMVLAGIEVCVLRIRNFDTEKYSNPFGYFSRLVWRTFSDIIKEEHQQSYFKAKLAVEDFILADSLADADSDYGVGPEEAPANPYFDWLGYEEKREADKAKKRKPKNVLPENALF